MIERPLVLIGLLLIVPIVFMWRMRFRRGRADLVALGGKWRSKSLGDIYLFKSFFSLLFILLFVVFLLCSLAGFRWGEELVEEKRSGREVVFVLDISNSMLAADLPPSRFQASLVTIRLLVEQLDLIRYALVVFKGEALIMIPMTEDFSALNTFLKAIEPSVMSKPGSNLEAGIEAALAAFSEPNRYQAIVIVTDGEFLSGNPMAAAQRAAVLGIPIFLLAAGTEEGASIILPGGQTVMDNEGRPVWSRLRPEPLIRLADKSGGMMFRLGYGSQDGGAPEPPEAGPAGPAAGTPAQIAAEVAKALQSLEAGELTLGFRRSLKERYRLFILLSLIFVSLHLVVKGLRWKNIF